MSSQRKIFNCKNIFIILICSLILGMLVSVIPWLQPNGGLWMDISWANLPTSSSEEIQGLTGEVHIVRDAWGVPQIFAGDINDLYLACGYVHAQDRLFQLDLYRRIAQGRLSELFGTTYLELDQYHRQLGFEAIANASVPLLNSTVLGLLKSYARGINQYMESIGSKIPVEIRVLGYFPEPWNETDSLTIERYVAWQLSASDAFQDLQMANLIDTYGVDLVFKDLFPDLQYNETFIVSPTLPAHLQAAAKSLASRLEELQKQNPVSLATGGSNCWVINGSHTATGAPLLASDPHLSMTLSPIWYEVQMVAPGYNVQGITYTGIPFIYQGHNPNIAWGWTGMQSDVSDFYYYLWNPSNASQYWWNNNWQPIEQRNTTMWVRVEGGLAPVEILLNYTVHGPLFDEETGRFALKWTGANGSRTTEALYELGLATNHAGFLSAIQKIDAPNLNFLYADTSGNIAYHAAVAQPIRTLGQGPSPLNGSANNTSWQGFIPFNQLPQDFNPASGLLVAANNRPVNTSYSYYLGYDFAAPYRANRITALLESIPSSTLVDMEHIQQDALSLHALAIKDIVASVILAEVTESEEPTMHAAALALQNWDGVMNTESIGATIWSTFSPTYLNNTFFDEYSAAGIPTGPYPSMSVLDNFTSINYDLWFNNVSQTGTQTRDDIILASFADTVEFLTLNLGSDTSTWQYNQIHILWVQHPMSDNFAFLNAPRYPVNGSAYTVNYAPGYLVAVGASYRFIMDLDNLANCLGVLPGGQRGNGYARNYMDQLGLWIIGEYHVLPYASALGEITEFASLVILIPG
ncbi:MAG: penicillin acylase family protein [Candidatus Thorarchaeota archaeon]